MKVEVRTHGPGGWDAPLPEAPADLALIFGDPAFVDAPGPLAQAARAAKVAVGCSTAGEIVGDSVREGGVVATYVWFDRVRVRAQTLPIGQLGSHAAGRQLAEALAEPDLAHLLILSDGLQVNGTELVEGVNAVLPEGVAVTGGLAGDGPRFERTWVLVDGAPRTGFVCGLGLYGPLRVSHGSRGGWDPFGIERHVTRSEGNRLFELDGKPALALYKEYLGDRASELPASGLLFPLAILDRGGVARQVVRTILSVDEPTQSLVFAGDIPQGARVQLMKANLDRLIDGAEGAIQACDVDVPVLAIAVSCVGRRLVLGARVDEEVEVIDEALPAGSSLVGFYSYGELSPLRSGRCDLHNQTMTLTTWCEG